MTCIAWDGTTLAADTLCTGPDDNTVLYGPKIFRTRMGLFAGSGDEDQLQDILDWVRAGAKKKARPVFAPVPANGPRLTQPC